MVHWMADHALLARDLFDKLVGQWDLAGRMGEIPLRQAVVGRWILGNLFVEVSCRSVLPAPAGQQPYEAVYHIGYNAEHARFVMHLPDTFGVALSGTMGIGERQGNSIPCQFIDADGDPFMNTFTWHPDKGAWTFEVIDMSGGQVRPFASKRVTWVTE
jgi:hypothetical protein